MNDVSNYTLDVETSQDFTLHTEEAIEPRYYVILDLNTGKPVRFWFGTLEQYNSLPEIYDDVCYNILERSCYVGEE